MADVSQWSTTASSNNSASPNGAPEGMAPSGVNNVIRENMAAIAKWYSDSDGTLQSTGSSSAYVLTTNSTHAALADMPLVVFRANHASTGSSTLAVDGLTAKSIKKYHDVNLVAGDIETGQIVIVVYNATSDVYELISSTGLDKVGQDVGTTASPQFTAINVGHASDTTLAKEASGIIAVEGNTIASLDLKQVWTKAQAPSTFSATLASVSGVLDYDAFQNFIITLASGSNTLAAPTTEADCIGQTGVMIFIQPSSSSAGTLSLHADYETAASGGITLSTANNDYDIVAYVVKADNSILLSAPQLNFG